LFCRRVLKFFSLFDFVYAINIKKTPPLAGMCNAEKGVQKDKRNQRWTTEHVRGYFASRTPLGLISTFAPIGMLDLG
jgi:hypothetical protein